MNNESEKFKNVMQSIIPHMTGHPPKVILAQVMIALKVEGILGDSLTEQDITMIKVIKDSIMANPEKKAEALLQRQQLVS